MSLFSDLIKGTKQGFDAIFGTDLAGAEKEAAKKNRQYQQSINQQNIEYQRESRELEYKRAKEFAQHGIQWKARDATAAGLHPLFAMGAGTSNYSPQFIGGQHETGSFRRAGTRGLNLVNLAQIKAINAQASRDEAAAALDLSRAARLDDRTNTTQDGELFTGEVKPGVVKPMPSEVISARPGDITTQAGQAKPGRQEYATGYNRWGEPLKRKVHKATEEEWSVLFDVENMLRDGTLNIHAWQRLADKIGDKIIRLRYGDARKTPRRKSTRKQRRRRY